MGMAGMPALLRGSSSQRPNIILIMADDLGFSDLGCYGGEIETPNLDALAAQGLRFAQFYNNARCCPTRSTLMSGLYPHQGGIGYMEPTHKYAAGAQKLGLREYQGFLRTDVTTLGEALQRAGYQTFLSGKWHLGTDPGQRPWERGFDRTYGILGGMSAYFNPPPQQIFDQGQPLKETGPQYYTTDRFTDRALDYLREAKPGQPYFLYMAYTAPHFNLDAWPRDIAKYRGQYRIGWDELRARRLRRQKELGIVPANTVLSPRHAQSPAWQDERDKDLMDLKMAVYAAAVDRMDQNIGRLLRFLRDSGQEENTAVIFLSDNGGEMLGRRLNSEAPYQPRDHAFYLLPWANASNTPFRLFKQQMHEGGISTPFIVRWPKQIAAGRLETKSYGHVMDLYPTLLDLAGSGQKGLEGKSLLPVWRGRGTQQETRFWEHGGNCAVRQGRWKLVRYYNEVECDPVTYGLGFRTGPWELYDIERDRTELNDLAPRQPQRVRQMSAAYERWAQRVGVVPWEEILRAGGYPA
jgi:arylsulfatase